MAKVHISVVFRMLVNRRHLFFRFNFYLKPSPSLSCYTIYLLTFTRVCDLLRLMNIHETEDICMILLDLL